jgi:ADP-ribose pyrophosphatase
MSCPYTHPSVLAGIAAGASWADPQMDPTRIDWASRQAAALIPFAVVDGRPVNPCQSTGIRYGRNELGHWGEQVCADAVVTATDTAGRRWLVLVERSDGHGWALPGGHVDPGEDPADAAVRELAEETSLTVDRAGVAWVQLSPRYVPDPRGSDEAWMVTVPARLHLGDGLTALPVVFGQDDARRAAWVPADSYRVVTHHLTTVYSGHLFAAHRRLLTELLG